MSMRKVLPLIMVSALGSGCALVKDASYNAWHESHKVVDDCTTAHRLHRLAVEAWLDYDVCHGEQSYSKDFARGFINGYADYLLAGDLEAPPAAPPLRYWRPRYETPEGHQAIHEWIDGHREGVAAARANGLREYFVLPSSGASLKGLPLGEQYEFTGPSFAALPAPERIEPPKAAPSQKDKPKKENPQPE